MYKDVPAGSEADLDNVYLLAHGISPDDPHTPDQFAVELTDDALLHHALLTGRPTGPDRAN